ncbi:EF-hand domain-containing protein [Asticcacaulis sp. SL142]|uniref:EF-hand domain-containing protein n=1 Tax=Asticcacaulis sp. SL142 TaxID=2995155 RepID=UPI00226C86A2|nr:EF-hand domain-containing protein [Asticcacaulis sp. SL142]WAC47272.1 EF-hand domain-containing protein [Asticcacaulis sp. SL142]
MIRTFYALAAVLALNATSVHAQPKAADPDRLADRLEAADANRDGMVTRQEFIAHRGTQFSKFDRNGDSYLTDKDIPRLAAYGERSQKFKAMMLTFDSNNDGRVSRTEFTSGPTMAFDMAETDRNGTVDGFELKHIKRKG